MKVKITNLITDLQWESSIALPLSITFSRNEYFIAIHITILFIDIRFKFERSKH